VIPQRTGVSHEPGIAGIRPPKAFDECAFGKRWISVSASIAPVKSLKGEAMKQLFLIGVLLSMGCSVPRSIPEGRVVAGQTVNQGGKVLILAVADGQEQGQPAANGSGRGMVASLRKSLMQKGIPISTTDATAITAGCDEASKINFDYVLKCVITEWEDNATAWSGKGDKLRISVELFNAKTKQLVAAGSHYRIATGFTLASGTPDRFMDECALGALSQIYGWPLKKD
jgi:hypothetical protein